MAKTSAYGHLTRFSTNFTNPNSPVDVGIAHRLANNLNHTADSSGAQVIAAFDIPGGGTIDQQNSGAADRWGLIWSSAPFDMPRKADGSGYDVRFDVAAAVRGTGTGKIAAVVAPVGYEASEVGRAGDNVGYASGISATTAAWLGGGLLTVDAELMSRSVALQTTLDSLGGSTEYVAEHRFTFSVWGQANTNLNTQSALISAAYAALYIGGP